MKWNRFELIWLVSFISIVVLCNFITSDTLVNGLIAILGVLNVVLIARGDRSNFYFGFVKIAIYSVVCLVTGYYGNFLINFLWFLPMQYIGYRQWDNELTPKRLPRMQFIALCLLTILVISLATICLALLGGNSPLLDALSAVCSMLAMLLMCLSYREHWYFWILVNITSVIMWSVAYINVGTGLTIAIMYLLYLCNALYGAWNWHDKMKKKKNKNIREVKYR